MKQFTAFTGKEFLEQVRSGRLMILSILFCLFGIMNPAVAKMTPWMLTVLSEQLEENGMLITGIEVDALTSWTQFFKNMPILLIIFLVMFSAALTGEYQKGTLLNIIAKGMKRWKILVSKMFVMFLLWTAGYLLTLGITYGYNAYFWDNRIARNLLTAVFGNYLVGLWLISVILPASAVFSSASAVTLSAGAVFAVSYLLSFLPAFKEYVPTFLLSSNELLAGSLDAGQCLPAMGITAFLILLHGLLSVMLFNKRSI
ncbi:MAG: ABC transporter permease subunit [Clostridiales bacterium]|nr:ABC transporter permease subunit [Clostridiales bacterium]